MRRQEALRREGAVRLWAILDEAVIRRTVGSGDVMREQLDHLAKMGRDGNTVTIQVIPFGVGAHNGMTGSFLLMDFPDPDPPLVYTENFSGGIFLEAEDDIARYRDNFQRLTALAASPADTIRMIKSAAEAV